ncbi:hypothetical protein Q0812_12775 [Brevundimonas sp. 2R-24]|uniref:Uncharacterized protein n=1 Tax=Peiella sedimenti TaxID=3061083 RepID=A0ABT8SR50_9CAUL|nr:hypothetical protein [Caulobacteraceae bacterium XZ-24]
MRSTSLTLRREAFLLVFLLVVMTVGAIFDVMLDGGVIVVSLDIGLLFAVLGLMFPWAVWRGERPFDVSPLWLLPIHRRTAALARTMAGGLWLVVICQSIFIWYAGLAIISGGGFPTHEVRYLVTSGGALQRISWTPEVWQWLTVFAAPLVTYLFASAALLSLRYPIRWLAGGLIATLILAIVAPNGFMESVIERLMLGPLGFDHVLTGGREDIEMLVRLPTGETGVAWRRLPDAERWLAALAAWLGLALAALVAAASRSRRL